MHPKHYAYGLWRHGLRSGKLQTTLLASQLLFPLKDLRFCWRRRRLTGVSFQHLDASWLDLEESEEPRTQAQAQPRQVVNLGKKAAAMPCICRHQASQAAGTSQPQQLQLSSAPGLSSLLHRPPLPRPRRPLVVAAAAATSIARSNDLMSVDFRIELMLVYQDSGLHAPYLYLVFFLLGISQGDLLAFL